MFCSRRLVSWWLFFCFLFSPLGGLFYFVKSHLLNIIRLRSKTLQDGGCDSIHFVETEDKWKLALINYKKRREEGRNFPVLLIHGLSSNRMAFDMGEKRVSVARSLAAEGYDVWILEMRGSNLSFHLNYRKDPAIRQWDFDDYLLQDLPAAINFILRTTQKSQLHVLGHSMGGTLLMSYIAGGDEQAKNIRSGITVGSSMTYHSSGSGYDCLLPLKQFAERFPQLASLFVPHGLVSQLIANFMGRGWERNPIETFQCVSTNTEPDVIRKIYKFGFHSIPLKLMLSLSSALTSPSGLTDREGKTSYLSKLTATTSDCSFPLLLIAGEKDLQCPPSAVETTFNILKQHLPSVKYSCFGKTYGHADHYGHFDLLIGKRVTEEVFPVLIQFLNDSDNI